MSEVIGRLNRTIAARGPDSIWVESRDALVAAYQTIGELHEKIARLESCICVWQNEAACPEHGAGSREGRAWASMDDDDAL